MRAGMNTTSSRWGACLAAFALAGCATHAVDVRPLPANPADFAAWSCERLDDELDAVQHRAAEVAYDVDEHANDNIVALGLGVAVFWPALLAMRPEGPESTELATLKGRFEALTTAARQHGCPAPGTALPAARAAALPIAVGERLVYEERPGGRATVGEWALRVQALRRDDLEFQVDDGRVNGAWRQDTAGNVVAAPAGALVWAHLLRHGLQLGQVVAGEMSVVGDPLTRARMRGQVVAVGPQTLAGRRFDVAVIDLYGDALRGESSTRVDGAIVVDRTSGVLLRLDLHCAMPAFNLQRRLSRIASAS